MRTIDLDLIQILYEHVSNQINVDVPIFLSQVSFAGINRQKKMAASFASCSTSIRVTSVDFIVQLTVPNFSHFLAADIAAPEAKAERCTVGPVEGKRGR